MQVLVKTPSELHHRAAYGGANGQIVRNQTELSDLCWYQRYYATYSSFARFEMLQGEKKKQEEEASPQGAARSNHHVSPFCQW